MTVKELINKLKDLPEDCEVVTHIKKNNRKYIAKEEAMMKLKDEGIVKPLKDSILRNERLSSQEQQELCAWIECAVDFGDNLDKCAKELEEAKKANEWHYVKDGDLPSPKDVVLVLLEDGHYEISGVSIDNRWFCTDYYTGEDKVIAWKEIVLPKKIE